MENKDLVYSPEAVDAIIADYASSRDTASKITVQFSQVNTLDVLLLLDTMSKKAPTAHDLAPTTEAMLDGSTITFWLDGKQVYHSVSYNRGGGNSLHMLFTDAPYLYDLLQQTCYALMLKKLTPHLESSN